MSKRPPDLAIPATKLVKHEKIRKLANGKNIQTQFEKKTIKTCKFTFDLEMARIWYWLLPNNRSRE